MPTCPIWHWIARCPYSTHVPYSQFRPIPTCSIPNHPILTRPIPNHPILVQTLSYSDSELLRSPDQEQGSSEVLDSFINEVWSLRNVLHDASYDWRISYWSSGVLLGYQTGEPSHEFEVWVWYSKYSMNEYQTFLEYWSLIESNIQTDDQISNVISLSNAK